MTSLDLPFYEGRDKGLICPESPINNAFERKSPSSDLENIIWYSKYLKPDDSYKDMIAHLVHECCIAGQKRKIGRCVGQLIANFIRLHQYCPETYLAFPRQSDRWKSGGRYKNPYRVGRKIIEIVDALIEKGYIEYHRGFQGETRNYVSRIKPTEKFIKLLEAHNLLRKPAQYWPSFPLVRVNITKDTENGWYPAPESAEVRSMTASLEKYNALLAQHSISADGIEIEGKYYPPKNHTGEPVYRVFNSDCLKHGGRFYGAFWMNCKKEQRQYITIDGRETVELDYKAQHIYLAYGLFAENPYSFYYKNLDPYKISDVAETKQLRGHGQVTYPRSIMKLAALAILNATSFNDAFQGLRQSVYKMPENVKQDCLPYITDRDICFKRLYDDFCEAHNPIKKLFFYQGLEQNFNIMTVLSQTTLLTILPNKVK